MISRLSRRTKIIVIAAVVVGALAILYRLDSPPGPRIDEEHLARASGVALVRVTSIERVDERPSDGNLVDNIGLEVIKSSGVVRKSLRIVVAEGGMRPPPSQRPPPIERIRPIKPGDLVEGQRYWLVFSSEMDRKRYAQGVIAWRHAAALRGRSSSLAKAVRDDRYRWRPQLNPEIGLTLEYLVDPGGADWVVRIVREGEILWSETLPGAPSDLNWNPWLFSPSHVGPPLADMLPDDAAILLTRTRCELPADAEAGLPAGEYFVEQQWDALDGSVLTRKVFRPQTSRVELNNRLYDPATDRQIQLTIYQWRESGGKEAGGEADAWYRREVRRYDGKTGGHIDTKVYRHDSRHAPDGWVEIDE